MRIAVSRTHLCVMCFIIRIVGEVYTAPWVGRQELVFLQRI